MDLVGKRALALRRLARDVAAGRCRIERAERRPRGCWRCRRSAPGRCSASVSSAATNSTRCRPATSATSSWSAASPALGRRATIPEVEEFYAPYEPYRGLVGALTLAGLHRLVAQGPPMRLAA